MKKLLILGGTEEARLLAERVIARGGIAVTSSLAGRLAEQPTLPGELRVGGFGGAEALAKFLSDHAFDMLIDVTHPFASTMSHHAAHACARAEVPWVALCRAPWVRRAADNWIEVQSHAEACQRAGEAGGKIFLTVGRQNLDAYAGLGGWVLIRLAEQPGAPFPLPRAEIIVGKGPFYLEDEIDLFEHYNIDVLVTKNSGGNATYGKIEAARRLGLPVVVVQRPAVPDGEQVDDVDAALAWIDGRMESAG